MSIDYGFRYYNEEHQKKCHEWDERSVKELTDNYLATFITHFASGNVLGDLPNPLLCPHPKFLAMEAKTRGWACEETSDGLLIKFPDQVQVLSPPPTTKPKKARKLRQKTC